MQCDICMEMPLATPDLGLVYVWHVHGTWNISPVLRTSAAKLCNSNFANSIRVNDLKPQNPQTGPADGQQNNKRIKKLTMTS